MKGINANSQAINLAEFYKQVSEIGDDNAKVGIQRTEGKSDSSEVGNKKLSDFKITVISNPDRGQINDIRRQLCESLSSWGGKDLTSTKEFKQIKLQLLGKNGEYANKSLTALEARRIIDAARVLKKNNVITMINTATDACNMPKDVKNKLADTMKQYASHPDVSKFLQTYGDGRRDVTLLAKICDLTLQLSTSGKPNLTDAQRGYLKGFSHDNKATPFQVADIARMKTLIQIENPQLDAVKRGSEDFDTQLEHDNRMNPEENNKKPMSTTSKDIATNMTNTEPQGPKAFTKMTEKAKEYYEKFVGKNKGLAENLKSHENVHDFTVYVLGENSINELTQYESSPLAKDLVEYTQGEHGESTDGNVAEAVVNVIEKMKEKLSVVHPQLDAKAKYTAADFKKAFGKQTLKEFCKENKLEMPGMDAFETKRSTVRLWENRVITSKEQKEVMKEWVANNPRINEEQLKVTKEDGWNARVKKNLGQLHNQLVRLVEAHQNDGDPQSATDTTPLGKIETEIETQETVNNIVAALEEGKITEANDLEGNDALLEGEIDQLLTKLTTRFVQGDVKNRITLNEARALCALAKKMPPKLAKLVKEDRTDKVRNQCMLGMPLFIDILMAYAKKKGVVKPTEKPAEFKEQADCEAKQKSALEAFKGKVNVDKDNKSTHKPDKVSGPMQEKLEKAGLKGEYQIQDNLSDGNCFFYSVLDVLEIPSNEANGNAFRQHLCAHIDGLVNNCNSGSTMGMGKTVDDDGDKSYICFGSQGWKDVKDTFKQVSSEGYRTSKEQAYMTHGAFLADLLKRPVRIVGEAQVSGKDKIINELYDCDLTTGEKLTGDPIILYYKGSEGENGFGHFRALQPKQKPQQPPQQEGQVNGTK